MNKRFTFKPGHQEEDHDHILLDGKPLVTIQYGEVDHRGRGIGGPGPFEIRKLVAAANRVSQPVRAQPSLSASFKKLQEEGEKLKERLDRLATRVKK